jgi:hypothetical protein
MILQYYILGASRDNQTPPSLLQLWESRRMFAGLDTEAQLVYCAVDQLLHGPDPPTGQRAQQLVGEIVQQYSSLGHCPGTHPHLRCAAGWARGANFSSRLRCLYAEVMACMVVDVGSSKHLLAYLQGSALWGGLQQ